MATTKLSSGSETIKANTSPPSTILLGLSGPSSSGKTTLARLLRSIFNLTVPSPSSPGATNKISLFILHQDDFYLTDALVPVITVSSTEFGTRDLQDWDCVESLDLDIFESTLRHVKQHGTVPEGSVSKEDQNAVGESGVSDDEVKRLRGVVEERLRASSSTSTTTTKDTGDNNNNSSSDRELRICILDGFLLYPPPPPPPSEPASSISTPLTHLHALSSSLLAPRLFLPSTRTQTLTRRARRTGYVTLEGFWTDPPGYVEDVVWPNFARDHAWMYSGGDVDGGSIDEESLLRDHGVRVCPGRGTWDMQRVLEWAVGVLVEEVEARVAGV
ncbi:hypothetical protein LTR84_008807 [Exophiala bonariae]|uniref:Nicotinamide riboside kinase n=1 Tax=Exophiala bonariae TaxID=1690606 RepID=A0AAV9MX43_9EURO|nr:hypothetical protein LTR84_008807 [Exophiala bonariae]